MRQFSVTNEGDLEDGHDSDGELGPFYNAAVGMAEILEDEEPHVESLGLTNFQMCHLIKHKFWP